MTKADIIMFFSFTVVCTVSIGSSRVYIIIYDAMFHSLTNQPG